MAAKRANGAGIRSLRDTAERMRRHEMEHALKLLSQGRRPGERPSTSSQRLTNKFLHARADAGDDAGRNGLRDRRCLADGGHALIQPASRLIAKMKQTVSATNWKIWSAVSTNSTASWPAARATRDMDQYRK